MLSIIVLMTIASLTFKDRMSASSLLHYLFMSVVFQVRFDVKAHIVNTCCCSSYHKCLLPSEVLRRFLSWWVSFPILCFSLPSVFWCFYVMRCDAIFRRPKIGACLSIGNRAFQPHKSHSLEFIIFSFLKTPTAILVQC